MAVSKLFGLSSRTALITGSSRGIGRAIALGFAEYGPALPFTYSCSGGLLR